MGKRGRNRSVLDLFRRVRAVPLKLLGVGLEVEDFVFEVWGLGFGVWSLGFGV